LIQYFISELGLLDFGSGFHFESGHPFRGITIDRKLRACGACGWVFKIDARTDLPEPGFRVGGKRCKEGFVRGETLSVAADFKSDENRWGVACDVVPLFKRSSSRTRQRLSSVLAIGHFLASVADGASPADFDPAVRALLR
jgi:hypothetical protein